MSIVRDNSPPPEEESKPELDNTTFYHYQPDSLGRGFESDYIGPMRSVNICRRLSHIRNRWREFKKPLDERRLYHAISVNDSATVIQLLQRGVSPSCKDQHMRSPLHLAACKGYSHIVRILLRFGADPNMKDGIGNTPLHLAACTNHIDVIMLLLQAGTNACSMDQLGRSPLQLAQSKLKILQMSKDPASTVKHQISQVIDMLMMFAMKQSEQKDILCEFKDKLNIGAETREHVDTQLRDLLDNLSSMSLDSGPSKSDSS